jgi:hypothetical protein
MGGLHTRKQDGGGGTKRTTGACPTWFRAGRAGRKEMDGEIGRGDQEPTFSYVRFATPELMLLPQN